MNKKVIVPLIICMNLVLNDFTHFRSIFAQSAMTNVSARHCTSLNGKWQVIIDPIGAGDWRQVWQERKPVKKTDFFEYSFEGGPSLYVPGDFNSQLPELTYFEGTVWYKKIFHYHIHSGKRLFLHFAAVNYVADVYLNGNHIGGHEGGFTPFQFEMTNVVKEGDNTIVVRVNNQRLKDGIPGLGFDWFNYGGITRDVNLIETRDSFIEDYIIQLKKHSLTEVQGWIQLNGDVLSQKVIVKIPEAGVEFKTTSNAEGMAHVRFPAKFQLWSPENPKLYRVIIQCETDTVVDNIGFRCIQTNGAKILLNGKPVFLKGVNIHEENPLRAARAFSEPDALILLTWAKEVGCNFVRLAHYPHNEYTVKLAEKMGLMVWDEIPVYQHIEFAAPGVADKISVMLKEMIRRDRNRCGVFVWSIANETYPTTPGRDAVLIDIADQCRLQDSTRLVTTAICTQGYENNAFNVWDPLYRHFDIIAINEYLGWYTPWQGRPQDVKWKLVCDDKPIIISEFGGEALFGNQDGPADAAASWREEYQEGIYKDQIEMFGATPHLNGVCAWLLVDYRSLGRMHAVYQNGWNRKGLLSDRGDKKKAWYVLKAYYDGIKNEE
jgi:beta-glucuronidase